MTNLPAGATVLDFGCEGGTPVAASLAVRRLRVIGVNGHVFQGLLSVSRLVEAWRIDYNLHRPHLSLGGLTPNELATGSR